MNGFGKRGDNEFFASKLKLLQLILSCFGVETYLTCIV